MRDPLVFRFSCISTGCALAKVLSEWQIKELKLASGCSVLQNVDMELSSAVSVWKDKWNYLIEESAIKTETKIGFHELWLMK